MPDQTDNIFYVDVGDTDDLAGRAFDGLVAGEFIDMMGAEVKITKNDLSEIVKNTQEAIDATKTESGEVVGLPIDPHDHNRGDAAGWITGVELVNDVIRFTPRWTEVGIDLISRGVKRFFSATLNLRNKIILGGTLTNWPATRDDVGKILLRPIELSMATSTWAANDDRATWITNGTTGTTGTTNVFIPAIVTVNDDDDSDLSDNINDEGENEMTLEMSRDELKEVIQGEIGDVVADQVGKAVTAAFENFNLEMPNPDDDAGDDDDDAGKDSGAELLAQFDLENMPDQVVDAIEDQLIKQVDIIKDRATKRAARLIAQVKHKDNVAEFVEASTQGTESIPRGLPVDPDELNKFALTLNPEQYKYFIELVDSTLDRGFVEFEELGHGKQTKGIKELPEVYAEMLRSGELELSDLSDPMLAPDLGDISDYNLKEFKE